MQLAEFILKTVGCFIHTRIALGNGDKLAGLVGFT